MTADTTLAPCPTEPDTKEFTALGQFLMSCSDVRMDGGKMIEAMAYLVARAQAPPPQGPALVPLTDEQAVELYSGWDYGLMDDEAYAVIRHVEAAHGITGAPNGKPA
ncbi:MAG: hypothetical protein EOO31_04375 [Comamonadaceae bacterium]|nr:MAG: hypothetical protein EOO31_04375 [Comamonadaceae bacterium]